MKRFSFDKISEHRNLLMGLQILLIVFFHFTEDCKLDKSGFGGFIRWFYTYVGSSGVDIFLLLSGFGLYYSWKKQPEFGPYCRKRLNRVLLPYLIVGVLTWGWLDLQLSCKHLTGFFKDLTFVTLFTDGTKLFWYIFMCLFCYLVFPLVFRLFDRRRSRLSETAVMAAVFALCTGLVFYARTHWKDLYSVLNLLVLRFPAFALGCWLGKMAWEKRSCPLWTLPVGIVLSVVAVIFLHDQRIWNRYALAAVNGSLCLLVIGFWEVTKVSGFPLRDWITDGLNWLGRHSLELYLVHVAIRKIMKKYHYSPSAVSNELLLIVLSLVATALLYRIVSRIQNHFLACANTDTRRY